MSIVVIFNGIKNLDLRELVKKLKIISQPLFSTINASCININVR